MMFNQYTMIGSFLHETFPLCCLLWIARSSNRMNRRWSIWWTFYSNFVNDYNHSTTWTIYYQTFEHVTLLLFSRLHIQRSKWQISIHRFDSWTDQCLIQHIWDEIPLFFGSLALFANIHLWMLTFDCRALNNRKLDVYSWKSMHYSHIYWKFRIAAAFE